MVEKILLALLLLIFIYGLIEIEYSKKGYRYYLLAAWYGAFFLSVLFWILRCIM